MAGRKPAPEPIVSIETCVLVAITIAQYVFYEFPWLRAGLMVCLDGLVAHIAFRLCKARSFRVVTTGIVTVACACGIAGLCAFSLVKGSQRLTSAAVDPLQGKGTQNEQAGSPAPAPANPDLDGTKSPEKPRTDSREPDGAKPKPRPERKRKELLSVKLESKGDNSPNTNIVGDNNKVEIGAPPPSVNAPGGIAIGRDNFGTAIVSAEPRLIQTLVLELRIKQETEPTALTGPQVSAGLSSAIALFTTDDIRIRFVTDYMLTERQIASDIKQLSLTYRPETPSDILGKDIGFLANMNKRNCLAPFG